MPMIIFRFGYSFLSSCSWVKISPETAFGIGHTADGVFRRDLCLVIGIRIKADAFIVDHVCEGVVEMR